MPHAEQDESRLQGSSHVAITGAAMARDESKLNVIVRVLIEALKAVCVDFAF